MQSPSSQVFTERLNFLIRERNASYRSIEQGTKGLVKSSYLWQLRKGHANNPSMKIINALAAYFRVQPSYFFSGSETDQMTGTQEDVVEEIVVGELDHRYIENSNHKYRLIIQKLITRV